MSPDNPIGIPFTILDEVSSSNNYAMAQVQAQMAVHGATWFAMHQNAGKGQRGKVWKTDPGKNITESIVIEPSFLTVHDQFLLTIAVSLACYDFFSFYAVDQVSIKWPNDIYWRDRKAGGILIENVLQGKEWKYSVIGIGMNINQESFPSELANPVSLRQITAKTYNVVEAGKALCKAIEQRWQQLKKGEHEKMFQEYNTVLYKRNEIVKLKIRNAILEARLTGVNRQGQLLIYSGQQTAVDFGTVEWLPA